MTLELSGSRPITVTLAHLQAEVRELCVSGGLLSGVGGGGLEKVVRCMLGVTDATWTLLRTELELSSQ